MNLSELAHGQTVFVRHGRSGRTAPEWGPWHETKLFLVRRDKPLPAHLKKRTGGAGNVGDIITLAAEDWPCEYSQGDYCGKGEFLAEDYHLEIRGLE